MGDVPERFQNAWVVWVGAGVLGLKGCGLSWRCWEEIPTELCLEGGTHPEGQQMTPGNCRKCVQGVVPHV